MTMQKCTVLNAASKTSDKINLEKCTQVSRVSFPGTKCIPVILVNKFSIDSIKLLLSPD